MKLFFSLLSWMIVLLLFVNIVIVNSANAASREDVLASLEKFSDDGDENRDGGNNLNANIIFIAAGVLVVILILFFVLRRFMKRKEHGVREEVKEAKDYLHDGEQIRVYIKRARDMGKDDSWIRHNLEGVGWKGEEIEREFQRV